MGNFDYKNICLRIYTRENLTDPRFVEFVKNWDFTMSEYFSFFDSLWPIFTNEYSERIVRFFIEYKDGLILPERCGSSEPLKGNFNKEDIVLPIRCLSGPAGALLLKKKYKYHAEIENEFYGVTFISDEFVENELLVPKRVLPEYMGKITFWFSKHRKIDMVFLEQLLRDLKEYLNTDNGIIFDQETDEIILDIGEVRVNQR